MRLSEAMMLGSATCKMVPGDWNSCAFGAAMNAIGVPQGEPSLIKWIIVNSQEMVPCDLGQVELTVNGVRRSHFALQAWPWLGETRDASGKIYFTKVAQSIWKNFDSKVCKGSLTFEQLVDYVRSIEPECGQCNQYICACEQAQQTISEVDETKPSAEVVYK